jgi:single-stranded DNA-binding protein
MLSNLNSVLIEGVVSGKPDITGKGREKFCSFVLSSLRYFRNAKDVERRETRVWVMIRDANLVKAALERAYAGRGLRVVGRIASDEDGCTYIEAEHVEYRPEPNGKKKKG